MQEAVRRYLIGQLIHARCELSYTALIQATQQQGVSIAQPIVDESSGALLVQGGKKGRKFLYRRVVL
jgi:hypothetical protein